MNISLDELSIKKIKLIDDFRGRFTVEDNEKLKLPQIIVVGDQSSGKSSILEAISGIKLPKGVDTVTKCPIIIQMRKSNQEKKQISFKNNEFRDIKNTEKELNKIQQEAFGGKLTRDPITLLIESPRVETLTIIDLPGFVKTQTIDQPDNIIRETHDIAKFYMQQDNSLIICVLPANQDISTTTTIKLATECNPDKCRILGVLTKIDKIDTKEASLLPPILKNEKLPIQKGYYGLIVGDNILDMSPENRPEKEKTVFMELDLWTKYENRLGLQKFTEALVKELVILIDKSLPYLRINIDQLTMETNKRLRSFSKYYSNTELQFQYITNTINEIDHRTVAILVKGDCEITKYKIMKEFVENNGLPKVQKYDTFLYFWHKIFKDLYDELNIIFKKNFTIMKAPYKDAKVLEELIKRSRIENISILNNPKPFKMIVTDILSNFKQESFNCLEKCTDIVEYIIDNVLLMDIEDKLINMRVDFQTVSKEILMKQKIETEGHLNYLFSSEESFFSQDAIVEGYDKEETRDDAEPKVPVKLSNSQSEANISNHINNVVKPNPLPQPITNHIPMINMKSHENENKNGKKLKEDLEKYLGNVIRRLGDVIPNFIRLGLFVNFSDHLKAKLQQTFYLPEKYQRYFNITQSEKLEITQLNETLKGLQTSRMDLESLEKE